MAGYMMKIGVYGLGRFGFFWAELLSRHFRVMGFSRNPERKCPETVMRVKEQEVLQCPVIFLCCSISAIEEVVKRIAPQLSPGTLVLDTCSVKVFPVKVMEEYLPEEVQIIATHPMFGPDSAKKGIGGLPVIISPVRAKPEKVKYWSGFFTSIGLKTVFMTPDEHDHKAAYTQGITHYVGRVLADLNLAGSEIATIGYSKLLEIMEQTCNDPWQLFLDLQLYNPYTKEMRVRLHQSLERIFKILEGEQ
jgi:prephenate dehydrogenase